MRPLSAANTRGPLVGVGARITAPYYGWVLVGALGITETISWGVLYYAFSVFVEPMEADLGWSLAQRLAYRESGDDQLVLSVDLAAVWRRLRAPSGSARIGDASASGRVDS